MKNATPMQQLTDYLTVYADYLLPVLEKAMREQYLRAFDDGLHTAAEILIGERNPKTK